MKLEKKTGYPETGRFLWQEIDTGCKHKNKVQETSKISIELSNIKNN